MSNQEEVFITKSCYQEYCKYFVKLAPSLTWNEYLMLPTSKKPCHKPVLEVATHYIQSAGNISVAYSRTCHFELCKRFVKLAPRFTRNLFIMLPTLKRPLLPQTGPRGRHVQPGRSISVGYNKVMSPGIMQMLLENGPQSYLEWVPNAAHIKEALLSQTSPRGTSNSLHPNRKKYFRSLLVA